MRKPMMIVLTTLALAGTASGLAMAHGKGDDNGERQQRHQEKRFEHMSEELGLSDEQRAQVKELMANSAERKASRDEKRDLQRQIRELDTTAADYNQRLDGLIEQAQQQLGEQIRERQARHQAMQEILTDEQEKKLAEMTKKRMDRMEHHGHHGGEHDKS
jgi:Spy/CpxP family protein refolding chaperone